jgi:hypothetical protein
MTHLFAKVGRRWRRPATQTETHSTERHRVNSFGSDALIRFSPLNVLFLRNDRKQEIRPAGGALVAHHSLEGCVGGRSQLGHGRGGPVCHTPRADAGGGTNGSELRVPRPSSSLCQPARTITTRKLMCRNL